MLPPIPGKEVSSVDRSIPVQIYRSEARPHPTLPPPKAWKTIYRKPATSQCQVTEPSKKGSRVNGSQVTHVDKSFP